MPQSPPTAADDNRSANLPDLLLDLVPTPGAPAMLAALGGKRQARINLGIAPLHVPLRGKRAP